MRKLPIIRRLLLATCTLCLAACQTSALSTTSVDRVLMLPSNMNAPYSNVLIVGATPRRDTDRNIEEGLSRELAEHDVSVHSFVKESSSTVPSEEAIATLVADKDIDAVIVVSVKLEGAELEEHETQVEIQREARGGSLLEFFQYDYEESKSPEYSDVTVDVIFVSDLYDASSKVRVYSLESSTAHGGTNYDIVRAESRAIVKRLRKDGLIR